MVNDSHRQAQDLAAAAERFAAIGEKEEAQRLYSRAAESESAALNQVPPEKTRTYSALGLSTASLFYKAGNFETAEVTIFRLLGSGAVAPWASAQLRELLEVVADERLLAEELGRKYAAGSFVMSLRGGEIGSGTGPLDLILQKVTGFRSLLYRFAELVGEYPLRRRGNPPKALEGLVQARVTEPTLGSYRLEIRLTEPIQKDMFEAERVKPEELSDTLFDFFESVNKGSREEVEHLIPDPGYRKALLDLTKNIAPGGKRLKEVGLYRKRGDDIQEVYLTPDLPHRIKESVGPERTEARQEEEREIRGVLRALHLDENWLEITIPTGVHERCDTRHDMLDDVVGPMVNHEVVITGVARKRRGQQRVLVDDIELVDQE